MDYSYKIALADGTEIHLSRLHQYLTYAGLYDGYPTRRLNKEIMKDAIRMTSKVIFGHMDKDYLIEPDQTKKEYPYEDPPPYLRDKAYWVIPAVTCISNFISSSLIENTKGSFSSLTIVWFQDAFALPIEDKIVEHIKSINWNQHGTTGWF